MPPQTGQYGQPVHPPRPSRRGPDDEAAQLRTAFPTARTPLLQPGRLTSTLTFRERQVLLLAAEHTSAEIADRLRLAVTTVNNNLARAYTKLGIKGRAQLRDLLDSTAGDNPPRRRR